MTYYAKNSKTSKKASYKNFDTQRDILYGHIYYAKQAGLTNGELRDMTKYMSSSISARLNEMLEDGDIVLTKRTRHNKSTNTDNGVYVSHIFAVDDDTTENEPTTYKKMKATLEYLKGKIERKGCVTIMIDSELHKEINNAIE